MNRTLRASAECRASAHRRRSVVAFVGGNVEAIHAGGGQLKSVSGDLENRRPGIAQLRVLGLRGAADSPVAGLIDRLAAALDASLDSAAGGGLTRRAGVEHRR